MANISSDPLTLNTLDELQLKNLAAYIAGLFEGDGHIWIPSTTHSPSGKRYTPRFHITFALHDLPLAKYLSTLLGGVQIRIKSEENACVLTVNNISKLIILVNLLNGLLRTPKIEQFNDLISWLNSNGYSTIEIEPLDNSNLLNNRWWAGFIDADGGFKIRTTDKVIDPAMGSTLKKGRVACSFSLEQRKVSLTGSSYEPILSAICSTFGCNLNPSTHGTRQYFIICLTSVSQLSLLIYYLDKYPLLSSKYLDYLDWRKSQILIQNKMHLTKSGRLTISQLKSSINRGRTNYTWDHLPK